jgi:uncharacterized membrane protein
VKWVNKGVGAILTTLLLLLAAPQFSQISVWANDPITSESFTLTVYLDGFVLINHELAISQTFPSVNVTLLGESNENILIVDDQNLPLDYALISGKAVIHSLGASEIRISYFTPDLTSKTGKYWTLSAEVSTNATVTLPEETSIISINNVPLLIESSNGKVTLVMPSGTMEIIYIAEHGLFQSTQNFETGQLVAIATFLIIVAIAFAFWYLKRRKPSKAKESKDEVDVNKLFNREKHLRTEEIQVIHFLAEKHGTAFEAELYAKLNLPRTSTWRLLKRLEKMEIVDIRKSRRQNIVSIRKKYMK